VTVIEGPVTVGTTRSVVGETSYGAIKVGETGDGAPVEIPVAIVTGTKDGPTVWMQNGVHGDEYVGAGALQRLLATVDPANLSGTLVVIPMLNQLAFRSLSRMSPQDGLDMNRIWPGKPMETAMHLFAHSEIAVHILTEQIVGTADVLLDVHDAGFMGLMSPYAAYYTEPDPPGSKSKELSFASGMDLIWETVGGFISEKVPGSVKTTMMGHGIPAVTLEVGGEGRMQNVHVDRMLQAFLNILRHLEMVPGEPAIPERQYFVNTGHWLRAPVGGMLWTLVSPLQEVHEGEPVARICDWFGQVRAELTSPCDGVVLGCRTLGWTASGMYVVNVTSEELA
jgi:predicted deacylase